MRDRMERFVLLPFSVGCVSESSIAVAVQQQQQQSRRSSKPAHDHKNSSTIRNQEEDEESLSSNESMKSSLRFMAISKPEIPTGLHRLFKSFKNISQLFAYKEEIDEVEDDIEIGFPTDVKHVTHIGIDGCAITDNNNTNNNNNNNNNNPIKGWEDLMISPELLPDLPPVSLGQFQLSMAAQADQANLVKGST